jgi:A/G-specific adenine glycosylase
MEKSEPKESIGCPIGEITISVKTVSYVRRKLLSWGSANFDDFPWRTSKNEFHTLVAEILLQRTKASQVISTYLNFIKTYPDPAKLAHAEVAEVEKVIRPLGLKWRAKLLVQLGIALEQHNGIVPDVQQALTVLPGVGAYVSTAYLSLHRKKRAAILDSNIVRFYGRFFGFHTGPDTRRNQAVTRLAECLTPARKTKEFNYALIDFTRNVCRPRSDHEICPVKAKCHLWKSQVHHRNETCEKT